MSDEADDDDTIYVLTPKSWITDYLMVQCSVTFEAAELFWYKLQEFATQRLKQETKSTALYPALIFNGPGGEIVPVECLFCDEEKGYNND